MNKILITVSGFGLVALLFLVKILRPVIEFGLPPLLIFQWFTGNIFQINSTLILILCGLYILIIIFKIRKKYKNHIQIQNALFAKSTFTKLNKEDQCDVLAVVFTNLKKGGYFSPEERFNKFNELQRYGFIALTLAELNIPATDDRFVWQWVEQPQIVPKGIEKQLKSAEHLFYKDYGIKLTLEV